MMILLHFLLRLASSSFKFQWCLTLSMISTNSSYLLLTMVIKALDVFDKYENIFVSYSKIDTKLLLY